MEVKPEQEVRGFPLLTGERCEMFAPCSPVDEIGELGYQPGFILTNLNNLYNWARRWSLWPASFGLACCAIEMAATGTARFDLARFGAEFMRPSPRQADLMIVSGTVTRKMAPAVVRVYNQMADPKCVIAMGGCANAGGPFVGSYAVVMGVDKLVPVDVYIPGCPPRPEALLHGLMTLQKKIDHKSNFCTLKEQK